MQDATKKFMNVIIDWSEEEVWSFIRKYKMPYCGLYDEGWKRIGCLFCPMQSSKSKRKQLKRYPKYEKLFIKAFEELYRVREMQGKNSIDYWKNGREMFEWWISGEGKGHPDQTVMFE